MSEEPISPKKKFEPIVGEGFVIKPSKSRADKKRELHKLILAHSDVHAAYKACEHFLSIFGNHPQKNRSNYAGMDNPLFQPLIEAIVISYARPFTPNESLGELKKEWNKFANQRLQETHRLILQARNELIAHSDRYVRKAQIVPPGDSKLPGFKSVSVGYAIKGYSFTIKQVETFYQTSGDLAQRLHKAVVRLIEELYEGMDLPVKPFDLKSDNEGL